jgi:2-hydroxychromene-2-carboxylate isomerase
VPQAAAAVARRVGLPLGEQLERVDADPGFTVRGFSGPAGVEDQMKFQNLLLLLGVAALEGFGEGFLRRIFRALWAEDDVVDEGRAEGLLAGALGPGGREWLRSRPEF